MINLILLLTHGVLSCCDNILIQDLVVTKINGQYKSTSQSLNSRPVYQQQNGDYYLYYVRSTIYSDGWYISSNVGEVASVMYTDDMGQCPDDNMQWYVVLNGKWQPVTNQRDFRVYCDDSCCNHLILQKTTNYKWAQGNYFLTGQISNGHPVYKHESEDVFIYLQTYYGNWHMWIEVDSLYAGFYAQGRNTNCPSEAKWEEMIGGTWTYLPSDALICAGSSPSTISSTTTSTTTTTATTTTTTTFSTIDSCCNHLILQKTTTYKWAQGNYFKTGQISNGHSVYKHESEDVFIYLQTDYGNWHMWIEVDSLYAGFYAQGRNTNCPSEAKWEEMIGGTWTYLPSDALICAGSSPSTISSTTTSTTTTSKTNNNDVYYGYTLHGFQIWYHVGTPQEVFDAFDRGLKFIVDNFDYSIVQELKRKVPIYMTKTFVAPSNYPTTHSMIQYTRNLGQQYGAIEVFNYDDFLRAVDNDQPSIVIHAMAKAVYNVVVDFSTQLEIDYTYQEAFRSGKYQNVQSYWGQQGPHYCLKDTATYFAECTEAYFSIYYQGVQYRNDYYPALKNSLMEFDYDGWRLIRSVLE